MVVCLSLLTHVYTCSGTRGCGHVRPDSPQREFWDFTVDHHAHLDLPAAVAAIRSTKAAESLGAPRCCFHNRSHAA
jgi:hypothetical protein